LARPSLSETCTPSHRAGLSRHTLTASGEPPPPCTDTRMGTHCHWGRSAPVRCSGEQLGPDTGTTARAHGAGGRPPQRQRPQAPPRPRSGFGCLRTPVHPLRTAHVRTGAGHLTLALSRRPHPPTHTQEKAAIGGGRLQCVVRGRQARWRGPSVPHPGRPATLRMPPRPGRRPEPLQPPTHPAAHGYHPPPTTRRAGPRTLAVSRANGRSEARAEAVGVGSSALFGPDVPPRSARLCPDSAPAADATTRHHPHDPRPQTRDRDAPPPVRPLDDARRMGAPAPADCRTATATHTRRPTHARAAHGRLGMGCSGHRLHRVPGWGGTGPPPAGPHQDAADVDAVAGPRSLGTASRRRPRAGRPRRARARAPPTGQARALRRSARHANPRPAAQPRRDNRRRPGVARASERRAHHSGPGSTRIRQGEAQRTAARAGPTGVPTPRRPRMTRQIPDTGYPYVPSPPACLRPPPRGAERRASAAPMAGARHERRLLASAAGQC
jgi:hypothetical protein